MDTTVERLRAAARIMDAGGRKTAPIRADVTRKWLMECGLQPKARGGALFIGQHRIITVDDQQADYAELLRKNYKPGTLAYEAAGIIDELRAQVRAAGGAV